MTRPTIQLPKGQARPVPPQVATVPTGLPKPKTTPKPEDAELAAASQAVEEFENQRRLLMEMKEDWENNYPEASLAQQEVLRQQDIVMSAIAKAKPLVAQAKKTIGDFVAQRKWSKPHYDETEVTQILTTLPNRLEVFEHMVDSGIIAAVSLQREAALSWFAQRPDLAEAFQSAFRDKEEQTCAVTVPKI
jgi:hypothetical protein